MAEQLPTDEQRLVLPPARGRSAFPAAVGVPHRFGMNILFLLVTMFALLFAFLSSMNVPPWLFGTITVLFMGTTVGQILLFQGRKPRAASAAVGSVLFPLEVLVLLLYLSRQGRSLTIVFYTLLAMLDSTLPSWATATPKATAIGLLLLTPFVGALFGYASGTLMAGVFCLMDRWQKKYQGSRFKVQNVESEL